MDKITPLVLSTAFYSTTCFLLTKVISIPAHLAGKDRRDFIGQHVSLVHCCVAIVFASWTLYLEGGVNYDIPMNQHHMNVLLVHFTQHTLGYVVYDTVYAEVFGVHEMTMRLHHIIGFVGGYLWVISDHGGSVGCCNCHTDCVFMAEISNPAMEARLILKERKMENTKIFVVVELTFAVTFLIARIFGGFLVAINSWASSIETIVCVAISFVVGLGWHWCLVILGMMAKKAKGALKQREDHGPLHSAAQHCIAAVEWLKQHKAAFHVGCFVLCFLLPVVSGKVLQLGTAHIQLWGFQVA